MHNSSTLLQSKALFHNLPQQINLYICLSVLVQMDNFNIVSVVNIT